jgi:hypothetical protein
MSCNRVKILDFWISTIVNGHQMKNMESKNYNVLEGQETCVMLFVPATGEPGVKPLWFSSISPVYHPISSG